jgi:hypothetical protein
MSNVGAADPKRPEHGRSYSMPGFPEFLKKKVVVENNLRPFTNYEKHSKLCTKSPIYGSLIRPSLNTVKKAFL